MTLRLRNLNLKRALPFINCSVCLWLIALTAIGPLDAYAFKTATSAAVPQRTAEENPNVVVWDNAYLDRRFGRDRATEASVQANEKPIVNENLSPASISVPESVKTMPKPPIDVLPNRSLLTGITRGTSARRAAALRMAETGRLSLQKGQSRRAIYFLEKALSMDANPFIHFYLARAHYQLADFPGSLRFLEVAESGFAGQPEWVAELTALRAALSSPSTAQHTPAKRNVAWTFQE
jgi:hypothetical protein